MRWIETDTLSNQNISSALAISNYVSDGDRAMMCDVTLLQIAGNGDYVMYVTRQIGGAGSHIPIYPKTTMPVETGQTEAGGQSGVVSVRSGDVLTVYVDGLAGDTTTVDTTVRWFDMAPLQPTTFARTLDVADTGEAGIDWGNIKSPLTNNSLSGTTIMTATNIETDTQDIQARLPAALVSGRIDASIGAAAANTITASALATDAVSEIADGVWDEALSGHATAGTAGKYLTDAGAASDPLLNAVPGAYSAGTAGYVLGNLDGMTITTVSVLSGTALNIVRGDSLSATFNDLGATTSYTSLWFTVKRDKADTDAQAVIQIKKNASATGDGLLYVNGAAAADGTKGSITISDAATGDLVIALDESITDDLAIEEGLFYDIQYLISSAVSTKTEGVCNIVGDVTRSVT